MAMVHPFLTTCGGPALSARLSIGMTGWGEGLSRRKEEGLNPSLVHQEDPSEIQIVNVCRFLDAAQCSIHRYFYALDHSEEDFYGLGKDNE
jgi:hypothetical protein